MILIGSMILGMAGCNNKSNVTTDSLKGPKKETTTEPTDDSKQEEIKATIETLLGNAIYSEYNKTVHTT